MKKIRRRQYLVDRPLQIGYAANMILLQLVVAVVTTGVVAWIVLFVLDRRLTGQMETGFLVKLAVIALFMAAGVGIWGRAIHPCRGRTGVQGPEDPPGRGPGPVARRPGSLSPIRRLYRAGR